MTTTPQHDNLSLSLTKLQPPKWRGFILRRERLSELLYDTLDQKLTIISAPAGYGKTTLLIDWIQQVDLPICWLTLDELDLDFTRFLPHFVAALGRIFPSFSDQVNANLEHVNLSQVEIHRLVTIITNLAYHHIQEETILVLDDYHLVDENPLINEFIDNFLQYADENIHLIISSRKLLSLAELTTLVARMQVSGMGSEDLAFQANEIQAILQKNYHITISNQRAEKLAIDTEGWITGLVLSAETMWKGMTERIQKAKATGTGLYNYMANQVLAEQPHHIREVLLLTSLFDEFDENLCKDVFLSIPEIQNRDWRKLVKELVQRNIFIQTYEEPHPIIRYHRLFREFLQATIQQENPQIVTLILTRLAEVYTEKHDWEKAFHTYMKVNDAEMLISFLLQAWSPLFRKGRYQTLSNWLQQVPMNQLSLQPNLLSLYGAIEIIFGRLENGIGYLNQVIDNYDSTLDPTTLARAISWRAWGFNYFGEYQKSRRAADHLLQIASENDLPDFRAEALRLISENFKRQGDIDESIRCLNEAIEIYQSVKDYDNLATVYDGLGYLLKTRGLIAEAEDSYIKALQHWRESRSSNNLAQVLNNLGVLYHSQGDFVRSIVILDEGLENARLSGNKYLESVILASIGELYMDLDAPIPAKNALIESKKGLQGINNLSILHFVNASLAAIARQENNSLETDQYLGELFQTANSTNSSEYWGVYFREFGLSMYSRKDNDSALKALVKAEEKFSENSNPIDAVIVRLYHSHILYGLGRKDEALEISLPVMGSIADLGYYQKLASTGREIREMLNEFREQPEIKASIDQYLTYINQFETDIAINRRKLRKQSPKIKFSPPKLEFFALGKTRVKVGDRVLSNTDWQSIKARDLLFFLLAFPNGMTKEQIGLHFWPDYSPNQLKVIFKKTIYRLRRATENDIILFDQERYSFNPGLDYEYDVSNFWSYLHEARQSEGRSQKSEKLSRAIAQYDGAYLLDIDYTWVISERERLWKAFRTAALELAQYYIEQNLFNDVLGLTHKVIRHDITSEPAYRLAMQAYDGLGDKAGVIRKFKECQRALLEELAATPSNQTIELYRLLTK